MPSFKNRQQARRVLLQALYQWQVAGLSNLEGEELFEEQGSLNHADREFFDNCLNGITQGTDVLDCLFEPYLDRKIGELGYVEKGALRAGTYELRSYREIPYRVVIDEWVELTKLFGAEGSHRYVNAVLDAVAKAERLREHE